MFKDRNSAAEKLSVKLENSNKSEQFDTVIAVTFSGLNTAERVSSELDLPLKRFISLKLRIPGNSELAFGAVNYDGTLWLDDAMVDQFMIDRIYIEELASDTREYLKEKVELKEIADKTDIKSKNILIVTDGVASGMQVSASIGACLKKGADNITIATPFVSQHAHSNIAELADNILFLEKPKFVTAVKDGYTTESQKI